MLTRVDNSDLSEIIQRLKGLPKFEGMDDTQYADAQKQLDVFLLLFEKTEPLLEALSEGISVFQILSLLKDASSLVEICKKNSQFFPLKIKLMEGFSLGLMTDKDRSPGTIYLEYKADTGSIAYEYIDSKETTYKGSMPSNVFPSNYISRLKPSTSTDDMECDEFQLEDSFYTNEKCLPILLEELSQKDYVHLKEISLEDLLDEIYKTFKDNMRNFSYAQDVVQKLLNNKCYFTLCCENPYLYQLIQHIYGRDTKLPELVRPYVAPFFREEEITAVSQRYLKEYSNLPFVQSEKATIQLIDEIIEIKCKELREIETLFDEKIASVLELLEKDLDLNQPLDSALKTIKELDENINLDLEHLEALWTTLGECEGKHQQELKKYTLNDFVKQHELPCDTVSKDVLNEKLPLFICGRKPTTLRLTQLTNELLQKKFPRISVLRVDVKKRLDEKRLQVHQRENKLIIDEVSKLSLQIEDELDWVPQGWDSLSIEEKIGTCDKYLNAIPERKNKIIVINKSLEELKNCVENCAKFFTTEDTPYQTSMSAILGQKDVLEKKLETLTETLNLIELEQLKCMAEKEKAELMASCSVESIEKLLREEELNLKTHTAKKSEFYSENIDDYPILKSANEEIQKIQGDLERIRKELDKFSEVVVDPNSTIGLGKTENEHEIRQALKLTRMAAQSTLEADLEKAIQALNEGIKEKNRKIEAFEDAKALYNKNIAYYKALILVAKEKEEFDGLVSQFTVASNKEEFFSEYFSEDSTKDSFLSNLFIKHEKILTMYEELKNKYPNNDSAFIQQALDHSFRQMNQVIWEHYSGKINELIKAVETALEALPEINFTDIDSFDFKTLQQWFLECKEVAKDVHKKEKMINRLIRNLQRIYPYGHNLDVSSWEEQCLEKITKVFVNWKKTLDRLVDISFDECGADYENNTRIFNSQRQFIVNSQIALYRIEKYSYLQEFANEIEDIKESFKKLNRQLEAISQKSVTVKKHIDERAALAKKLIKMLQHYRDTKKCDEDRKAFIAEALNKLINFQISEDSKGLLLHLVSKRHSGTVFQPLLDEIITEIDRFALPPVVLSVDSKQKESYETLYDSLDNLRDYATSIQISQPAKWLLVNALYEILLNKLNTFVATIVEPPPTDEIAVFQSVFKAYLHNYSATLGLSHPFSFFSQDPLRELIYELEVVLDKCCFSLSEWTLVETTGDKKEESDSNLLK